jgi:hypothetical protein
VLKRSAALLALYLVGLLAVWAWALSHWLSGTVGRENAALVIVLPFAWTLGFWPTVAPLLVAWKVWSLQALLEEHCERRALGLPSDAPLQEIEDTFTRLVAQENHVPERWARRVVRLLMRRAQAQPAAPGS